MKGPSRRRFLEGCVFGVAGLAGCSSLSGPPAPACTDDELVHESDADLSASASWPTYQYDAANTGHNPTGSGPKDSVELAWRYPACTEARSGAVVDGGTVAAGGFLVNGRTGQSVGGEWDPHASTPTFADGRLYVGAHDLLARDAGTGELDWTFESGSDSGGLAPPTVVDGTVYTSGQFDDPTVYAVDAAEGTEDWQYGLGAESRFPLAVAESTVFVVDENSTVYGIDAENGDEQWRRTLSADVSRSTPVVADGTLYLCSFDGSVLALNAAEGVDLWRRDIGAGSIGPPAVANGTIVLPGPDRSLVAMATSNGDETWKRSVDENLSGPPVIADDVVYVRGDQRLYAIGASSGEERWQFQTRDVRFGDYVNAGINSGIAVVDGLVFLATGPGDLYALSGQ